MASGFGKRSKIGQLYGFGPVRSAVILQKSRFSLFSGTAKSVFGRKHHLHFTTFSSNLRPLSSWKAVSGRRAFAVPQVAEQMTIRMTSMTLMTVDSCSTYRFNILPGF
jgi:hypothetical protein